MTCTSAPDVVWFGEMPMHMDLIYEALSEADLFVALGHLRLGLSRRWVRGRGASSGRAHLRDQSGAVRQRAPVRQSSLRTSQRGRAFLGYGCSDHNVTGPVVLAEP